jgi:hypothetical protein
LPTASSIPVVDKPAATQFVLLALVVALGAPMLLVVGTQLIPILTARGTEMSVGVVLVWEGEQPLAGHRFID